MCLGVESMLYIHVGQISEIPPFFETVIACELYV